MVVNTPIALVVLLLILLSAFFSAMEAGVLSINKVRLRHLVEQGNRSAKLTFGLLTRLDQVIGTLLVANNLVNVTISAIFAWILISWYCPTQGLAIATFGTTTLLLLLC